MRVYLHSSSEALVLEDALIEGQRIRWFVRRPSDVQEGYSGDLVARLGVDPAMVSDQTFVIEDHDGYFPNADDDDAWWIEGTVASWVPNEIGRGYVLVDLEQTILTPHNNSG